MKNLLFMSLISISCSTINHEFTDNTIQVKSELGANPEELHAVANDLVVKRCKERNYKNGMISNPKNFRSLDVDYGYADILAFFKGDKNYSYKERFVVNGSGKIVHQEYVQYKDFQFYNAEYKCF